jgi:uncharacterized cysteine cluster protein YcgN (CxxCxxCC family)
MADGERPFWKTKTLGQMTQAEWESLCDGCGKCCLNKLIDTDTEELFFTNVACRLLDTKSCQCTRYKDRSKVVKDCIPLTPRNVKTIRWLPDTCAYRLRGDGQPLPQWHYLMSGDRTTVHTRGPGVAGRVISETVAGPLEHHVVDWPDAADDDEEYAA